MVAPAQRAPFGKRGKESVPLMIFVYLRLMLHLVCVAKRMRAVKYKQKSEYEHRALHYCDTSGVVTVSEDFVRQRC